VKFASCGGPGRQVGLIVDDLLQGQIAGAAIWPVAISFFQRVAIADMVAFMTQKHSHPSLLRLAANGERLEIVWDDGDQSAISAGRLRSASRSAEAVRAEIAGIQADRSVVTITDVEPVGGYAVRLFFSDGHDRGIYPWRYLRELSAA